MEILTKGANNSEESVEEQPPHSLLLVQKKSYQEQHLIKMSPVNGATLKLKDMDEKNMHNLFLKNMAGLIEEVKNPSPCLNP